MATANFSIPNTSKHYCVFSDDDDFWALEFNEMLETLKETLEEKIRKLGKHKKYQRVEFYFTETVYPGFHISRDEAVFLNMEIMAYDRDGDVACENYLTFVVESGYYEGVMFNYKIERSEYNYKYVDDFIDRVINIYEKELEKIATHRLQRVGQFSNGETIYDSY